MNRIPIVYILGSLELGGTERQFLELMRRIDRDRFDARVLAFHCQGQVRRELERLDIPFRCLAFFGLPGKFRPASYAHLYRVLRSVAGYLRQERPQIVQSFLYWANVYGSIAAKLTGVPVIITGRRATMEPKYTRLLGQSLQNLSNACATCIVSNSDAVKQETLRRDAWVNEAKVRVIVNGVNVDVYAAPRNPQGLRTALTIPPQAPVIGMVASLQPRKRHQDVLRAAAQVAQKYPDAIFLLVGRDDGIRARLERLAASLGVARQIRFTGERSDIPDLLAVFDVQVLASSIEGVPNAILEGMAAGNAIVATDIAGNSEAITHEHTGLLIPVEQPAAIAAAILRLLDDAELRDRLGRAAQIEVARKFGMDRMVERTEALYQELVTTRSVGR